MILVIKKDKIALIALIFLLSVAVISLNIASGQNAVEVANDDTGKRTVVIDAGHGGEDPGAVSDYSGLKEKDVNLIIAKKVRELLEAENYNVIMTRKKMSLITRKGPRDTPAKEGRTLQPVKN